MELKINIHEQITNRVFVFANDQKRSVSMLVQEILIQALGMEGEPLDNIYGDKTKLKNEGNLS